MPRRSGNVTLSVPQAARFVWSAHLVGVKEAARAFNVNPATFSNWAFRRSAIGMPQPVSVLSSGTFYDLQELVRWWSGWTASKSAKAGELNLDMLQALGVEVPA